MGFCAVFSTKAHQSFLFYNIIEQNHFSDIQTVMDIRFLDTTSKKDVSQFIHFPFELYCNNPNWTPPLINDMRFNMDRARHPTYKHADVDFLIAESAGQTLGRLAVIHNHRHTQTTGRSCAFFYYFDAVNDTRVSSGLFDAAFDWARKRGLTEITGPRGLLRFDGTGLLIKGFEYPAMTGMAYNHAYYDDLVTDAGFVKLTDHYSGYVPGDYRIPPEVTAFAERVKQKTRYRVKTFADKKELRQWIKPLAQVFNSSFAKGRDFYPVDDEEFMLIAERLLSIVRPELIKFIMYNDRMVGFVLAYPDVSDALRKTKGELLPFGWVTLMQAPRKSKYLILNGYGLVPEHQGRGATALMYTEMYNTGKPMGFEYAETLQIDEGNYLSWSEHEHLKIVFHKAHRSYIKYL